VGFGDLDELARPRGVRLLARVGRLPEATREKLLRHFKTVERLFSASARELEQVEGIGEARAAMLRRYFDRWRAAAATWDPDPT
jgi:diadenylate cyclase